MAQAAKKLGIDHVELLKINAPGRQGALRSALPQTKKQAYVTQRQRAAKRSTRARRSSAGRPRRRQPARSAAPRCAASASPSGPTPPARSGSTAWRSSGPMAGCRCSPASATSAPSRSFDCQRVYAEVLDTPWEQFEVRLGQHRQGPAVVVRLGRQSDRARDDPRHATPAAPTSRRKLQEVAARALGGDPASYQVANGRVFSGGRSLSLRRRRQEGDRVRRQVRRPRGARRHQRFTKNVAEELAGQGLIGVAKDNYKRDGNTHSLRGWIRRSRGRSRDRCVAHRRTTPR